MTQCPKMFRLEIEGEKPPAPTPSTVARIGPLKPNGFPYWEQVDCTKYVTTLRDPQNRYSATVRWDGETEIARQHAGKLSTTSLDDLIDELVALKMYLKAIGHRAQKK